VKPESRELLEKFNKELSCFNCTHCDRNQKLEIFNPPAMFLEPKEYIGVTTPPVVFILSYPKKIDEDNKRIFSTPDKTRFKSWLVKAKLTNVYITNAVKCPTDDNQEPTKRQILKCASLYLMKELAVISPRVVVTVGKKALQAGFHNYTSEMLDNMVLKRHHTGAFAVYPIPHPFSFENSPDEELEQKVIEFLSNAFKENNEYPSIE
jgi:uracil-DNA glycosylase family 4